MARLTGVFGGTFDPPHIGHLVLADEAWAALGLDRVLWVVTGVPPHKPEVPISPVEVRLEMVHAAIEDNPHFDLSLADVERPEPHYTVGTLKWLADRHPGEGFVYLIGSDSLRDLPSWHQPAQFLEACTLLGVMQRPEIELDLESLKRALPGLELKLRFFDAPMIGASGHEIRRRAGEGAPYRYLVPKAVHQIIEARGLYR